METVYIATNDTLQRWGRDTSGWEVATVTPAESLEVVRTAGDQETVYLGSFESGLLRSRDGGQTFEAIGTDDIEEEAVMSLAIDPSDPTVLLAGTEPSNLYRSTDAGDSWSRIDGLRDVPSADAWSFPPRPDTHHVRWVEIARGDSDRWYVGIEAGAFLLTSDAGTTWVDRPTGSRRDNHWLATHPEAPDRIYSAAGDGYAESHDRGETWVHPQTSLAHRYVWSVAVDPGDPDTRIVSAAHSASHAHRTGESYVYRRRGDEAWERLDERGLPMGEGVYRPVLAAGKSPGTFVAASNRGVFRSDDAGSSWERLPGEVAYPDRPVRGIAVA